MHTKQRFPNAMFHANLRPGSAALAILITLLFLIFALVFMMLTAQPAQAQTYKVIYAFTGGADGAGPGDLVLDQAGNLYGTTGGGHGTVFKLSKTDSGWVLASLYSFTGGSDGDGPTAVIIGPDSALYGTTNGPGCGTVFKLQPPLTPGTCNTGVCSWTETVLFQGDCGGFGLGLKGLIFDQSGRLDVAIGGTPYEGSGCVAQLTPMSSARGRWVWAGGYCFAGLNDGGCPTGGLVFDLSGNLYGPGTCSDQMGVVFEFPSGVWWPSVLHDFQESPPSGGLIFDETGNLYGTTGGSGYCGSVFMLSPSGDTWTFTELHEFNDCKYPNSGPQGTLAMDTAGNLYGTTLGTGLWHYGSVFKLIPENGGWTYTLLHDFRGGSDGAYSTSNVLFDANGNLYGTTNEGGVDGHCCGVIFEVTP